MHALFDVRGAEPDILADGAATPLLECAQDAAAGRVDYGLQGAIEVRVLGNHNWVTINLCFDRIRIADLILPRVATCFSKEVNAKNSNDK